MDLPPFSPEDSRGRRRETFVFCAGVVLGFALLELFSVHAICWWGEWAGNGFPWTTLGATRPSLGNAIFDYDELWHLASGRAIVEQGRVPDRDPFTFTAGETPWVNTNWLAQVVLYRVYEWGGLPLAWLFGRALFLGAVALVHERMRRRGISPLATVPVAFYILCALRTASTIRPQGWTFLLLALTLLLLDFLKEKPGKGKAAALLGTLVLAGQLHGGFVFPYAACGLFLVAEVWDLWREEKTASRQLVLVLALVLVLGLLSFALHPHGFRALLHPIAYVSDPRVREIFIVNELVCTDPTTEVGFMVEEAVLALLVLALIARRAWATSDVLLVLVFAHLAFQSLRGLHYLAIVAALPLALAGEGAIAALRERAPSPLRRAALALGPVLEPAGSTFARWLPLALLLGLLTATASSMPFFHGKPNDVSQPQLRLQADVAEIASFIDATDPPGRLFNVMDAGGLLVWKLWPKRQVFIDGRGDLHARALDRDGPLPADPDERGKIPSTWRDWRSVVETKADWEQVLDRRGCDLALTPRETLLERALRDKGWRAAKENATQALFVRPGSPADRSLSPEK